VINEKLKEIREKSGLSQVDFANRLGLSPSTYGFYERGEQQMRADTIVKLCNEFNVSADWLLGTEGTDTGIETYKDAILLLDKLFDAFVYQTDSEWPGFHPFERPITDVACIVLHDATLSEYIDGRGKMDNLLAEGTIDKTTFETWLNGKKAELDTKITEYTNPDDLPF